MESVVKQLQERFPNITWSVHQADLDTINTYGDGKILRGFSAGKLKDFFVLDRDKNKLRWGVVIAHELGDENVQSDTGGK